MGRLTAYTRWLVLLATLVLLVAACAPAGPGGEAPSPSPAQPEPAPQVEPSPAAPSPAATDEAPAETPAEEATPTRPPADPYGIDYDYEYDVTTPSMATPAVDEGAAAATTVSAVHGDDQQLHLAGPDGMALYVFTQDEPGISNCAGDCAAAWPPLTVEEGESPAAGDGVAGELALIERDDGSLQVTYDGAPLYYYVADQEPGDTTGEGVGGVWFLARP